MKSNILLISNMYPSQRFPSYGVFVVNTEKILQSVGYSIDKAVMFKQPNKVLKVLSYLQYYLEILFKGLFLSYDYIYVHYGTHNSFPLNIVKLFNKKAKIIVNLHGSDVVPETKVQEKLQKPLSRLLENAHTVVTPSKYYKNLVNQKYKIDVTKIKVFPSGGVDPKIFNPHIDMVEALKKLNLDPKFHYFGFVGRLDYKKGWDVYLRAVKRLYDEGNMNGLRAIVVGNGKDKDKFMSLVDKFNLNKVVIMYDLLPQDRLAYIYNVIDVFCFPTMRQGESLGLVGLEAMACGTPVIGSKIGGLLDYIEDGKNGYLFDVNDHIQLSIKIKEFYDLCQNKKENMSASALETATKYYVKNVEKRLASIFCCE